MRIGQVSRSINFIPSRVTYKLVCSPTVVALDGNGVSKDGYTDYTVSVNKMSRGTSMSVTDEDRLVIAVTKVFTSGATELVSRSDGKLSTARQEVVFSLGTTENITKLFIRLYQFNSPDYVSLDQLEVPVLKDGKNGQSGVGISSADVYYYKINSTTQPDISTIPTASSEWSATTIDGLGSIGENDWVYSAILIAYTDGKVATTMTGVQLVANGRYLATVVEAYANGSSSTVAPADSSFKTSGFVPTKGSWLWTANAVTYKGSTAAVIQNKVCTGYVGDDGQPGSPGADGNGIISTTSLFQASRLTRGVGAPTSQSDEMSRGWFPAMQQVSEDKPYLWKCTRIVMTKTGTTYTTPELVYTYTAGSNVNLLDGTDFNDRSLWPFLSPEVSLAAGLQGRNAIRAYTETSGEESTSYTDITKQSVYGSRKVLDPLTWYTLSFWMKTITPTTIYINQTSSDYGFAMKTLYLMEGVTYTVKVKGYINATAVTEGKWLRAYVNNDDWSWFTYVDIKSTTTTEATMTFTVPSTGTYYICSYYYDNTTPRQGYCMLESYTINDDNGWMTKYYLTTYLYPGVVNMGESVYVDGIERVPYEDGSALWEASSTWVRHTYIFQTSANLSGEQTCLFRLLPTVCADLRKTVDITLVKLERGMVATGYDTSLADRTGKQGKTGRIIYPAGLFDNTKSYTATDSAAPMVFMESGGVKAYYYMDKTATWPVDGASPSQDYSANGLDATWKPMTNFQAVFTDILMANFGKLASAIFSGDYMISQYGVENGEASANYRNFLGYNEDGTPKGFDPNICIDFLNGHAIFKGDSLFQGTIKSANFFQNLDFITAESDGITHTSDRHMIDRTASISDVMLLSGDFGHWLKTIDGLQYHVAKTVYLTIPNANLEKFRGKQIRIVNNAWCKLSETTTGSYYFSSNVEVYADGGGMIYDMSLSFGGNTLRDYWSSLNMNSQKISSMTLLSAPFDGNDVGTTWNWVIIDKKEMTPEEVRELKELY